MMENKTAVISTVIIRPMWICTSSRYTVVTSRQKCSEKMKDVFDRMHSSTTTTRHAGEMGGLFTCWRRPGLAMAARTNRCRRGRCFPPPRSHVYRALLAEDRNSSEEVDELRWSRLRKPTIESADEWSTGWRICWRSWWERLTADRPWPSYASALDWS